MWSCEGFLQCPIWHDLYRSKLFPEIRTNFCGVYKESLIWSFRRNEMISYLFLVANFTDMRLKRKTKTNFRMKHQVFFEDNDSDDGNSLGNYNKSNVCNASSPIVPHKLKFSGISNPHGSMATRTH